MRTTIDYSRPPPAKDQPQGKTDFRKLFGITLVKNTNNRYIQEAIKESKDTLLKTDLMYKDKIEELKLLRKNIAVLTPKTVSSHNSDLDGLTEVDFNDSQAFMNAQKKLEEKNIKREEYKRKKAEEEAKKSLN